MYQVTQLVGGGVRQESHFLLPSVQCALHVPLTFKHPIRKASIDGLVLNREHQHPIEIYFNASWEVGWFPFYCHCEESYIILLMA